MKVENNKKNVQSFLVLTQTTNRDDITKFDFLNVW